MIPLAPAAIGDLYSPRERGCHQGYVSAMWGSAQNTISPQDFGSSTATLKLTRAIEASLAVSIFGALLASRATSYLSAHLGSHATGSTAVAS